MLEVPLNVMLRYNETGFDSSSCKNSMKPKFYSPPFDLQIGINDCTVNELLLQLYEADMLHIPLKSGKLTTSALRILLGKDIVNQFGADMPCKLVISPEEVP